jgi:hypothetical protein
MRYNRPLPWQAAPAKVRAVVARTGNRYEGIAIYEFNRNPQLGGECDSL